jgi:hypothetical protein
VIVPDHLFPEVLRGGAGFALGVSASAINLGGLWAAIRAFCNPAPLAAGQNQFNIQALLVVLACFVKMPIFIGAGYLAWRTGQPAPVCFIAGVGLVYSLVIGRVSRTR